MKKFLALSALVLGMVSCQTEPEGFDVNVGGEQDVNITVSLPEGTRADSAMGAFENVDFTKYDVRFQCEVHYGDQVKVLPVQYGRGDYAVATATFPVRLIANREYTFVVWADLVAEGSESDLRYDTTNGLSAIEIKDWKAMDETRDAYTCSEKRMFTRANGIGEALTLTRPFAKLRVITTDMEELMGVKPTWATVQYTTPYYTSFNAYEQKPYDLSSTGKDHSELFDIVSYGENGASKTLFADYFFAKNAENGQAPETVAFTMEVFDENGATIDEPKTFNTSIPVKRNFLTTIKGNILTYADDFTVEIDPAFANAGTIEDQPYYQVPVTNGADLLKAISEGREIIALNNIVVTEADKNFKEAVARRSNTSAKNPVLNLNGKTITFVNNNSNEALITIPAGSSLTINDGDDKENKGTIVVDGSGAAIENNGTINIDGVAIELGENAPEGTKAIENNGTAIIYNTEIEEGVIENSEEAIIGNYVYTADDLVKALEDGKNVFFANDIKIDPASMSNAYGKTGINVKNGQTIDGNGYTLNIKGAGGTWDSGICTTGGLIKNLKVTGSFRGIFVKGGNHTEKVVLEGVTLEGVTYTISVDQANGQGIEATNCTFNGWTSYAATIGEVKFTDCSFGKGNGYAFCRPYAPTTFVRCEFSEGYGVDARGVSTFDNCTLNGVDVTVENIATLVTGNIANAKLPGVEGTFVSTGDQLVAAMKAATADTTIICATKIVVEGATSLGINGATVIGATFKNASGTAVTNTINGKFVNCTFEGSNALRWCYTGETCEFEGCVFSGDVYGVHFDGGSYPVTFRNCTISGFNAFAGATEMVTFDGCTFVGNGKSGYNGANLWGSATMKNCEFTFNGTTANEWIDCIGADKTYTFENCTVNGVAYTAENYTEFEQIFSRNSTNAKINNVDVIVPNIVDNLEDLNKALANGWFAKLANDLTINEGITAPYGNKTALSQNGGIFDGNGKTITSNIAGDSYIYMTNGGTTKNLTVTGAFRGIMIMSPTQTVRLENVVSGGKGVVYAFNTGEGDSTQDVIATNCTFNGWSSWSEIKSATFTNCTFGQGSEYSSVTGRIGRPYVNTLFDGCHFCSKFYIDLSALKADQKVTLKNCTVNGVKITAENWTSLVAPEDTCGDGQISVELKNGTFLTASNVADYIIFE